VAPKWEEKVVEKAIEKEVRKRDGKMMKKGGFLRVEKW